jgi:hypothetical protein
MTIGIGLLCEDGKQILLSADTRGSYGGVTSNDQTAKLFELPGGFCGSIAGIVSQCQDVINELYDRINAIPKKKRRPEAIRECIREVYYRIFMELADEHLRNDPKITFNQYQCDKTLAPQIRDYARRILKALEVDVHLIVAGFCEATPALLVANGGASVTIRVETTPGNATIGTGGDAALYWLNYRQQNLRLGLARSLFHLTEAKQFAELEGTVGPFRHTVLVSANGVTKIEGEDALVQGWWNRYGLPSSLGLDDEDHSRELRKLLGI